MNTSKVSASSVSRKLATTFKRENYFAPGHIAGWGTLTAGFKVATKEGNVTVEWVAYSTPDEVIASKVDEMASFLSANNFNVEKASTWRGPFLIVKGAN